MRYLILFVCFYYSTSIFGQIQKESFKSEVLKDTREVIIYTPPKFNKKDKKEYPLLLILDGNYLFDPIHGIISYSSYWEEVPEMIMVAVNFKNFEARKRDYEFDPSSGLPNETAVNFYEFLEMELIPYLEANYKLASLKMIAGHGESAGFLNFFLYKENPVFNAYFCFNPELPDFSNERVPQFLSKTKRRFYYYLSMSEADNKKIKKNVPELNAKLKEVANPLLTYHYQEFKNSTHYSSLISAVPDALTHLYAIYQPITLQEFHDVILKMEGNYAQYVIDKYKTIHELLGIKMSIRPNDFNAIEVAIIKNKAYEEYEKLAKLAAKEHPKTMLSNYYMGLFYYNMGVLDKALKEYQKAFSMETIGDLTREKIMDKIDSIKAELKK